MHGYTCGLQGFLPVSLNEMEGAKMPNDKQQWAPGALLSPVPPVLVSSGTLDVPNLCTAAWCGMLSSKPPITYVSLKPERHSFTLIQESGEFVINLPTAALVRAVDYCGVRSGRDENKFETCGLTPVPAFEVGVPLLKESPMNLECRVIKVEDLGSHHMFMAQIVSIAVNEALLDENGKLHMDKAGLLTYAHGEYFALGEKLGKFGYSVRKRQKQEGK